MPEFADKRLYVTGYGRQGEAPGEAVTEGSQIRFVRPGQVITLSEGND